MEKIEKTTRSTSNFVKILIGSLISLIISIVLLLVISIILTYTDVSENIITTSVIIISALSIFIGSIISAININKIVIINGSIVWAIYMITIYLLSSIFVTGFSVNAQSIIMIIVSIVAGMIGGIIGVNFHK